MRCPKDDSDLIEIERQGIEIDYCPTCKGVWLDRSELDQLINRSSATTATVGRDDDDDDDDRPRRRESRERSGGFMDRARGMLDDDHRDRDRSSRRDRDDDRDDDDRRYKGKKKKSKRGMLEDLFDF